MQSQIFFMLTLATLETAAEISYSEKQEVQPAKRCKCIPGNDCWPSTEQWDALNSTIDGQLIHYVPLAQSCYQDSPAADECREIRASWKNDEIEITHPLARYYPHDMTCPPLDIGETGNCSLGQLPVYVVNATGRRHIRAALKFAREHNLRLTVINTAHDINGRVDGFASLAIWVRNLRNKVSFEVEFEPPNGYTYTQWKGSVIRIDGMYQWRDVYEVAMKHQVIVVGGSPTVGANGGWVSGGGHGPAFRNYGMGANQLLEAEVMLANGRVVAVNHCKHASLFRALRGGGPGYGIVLSTTIKTYPNVGAVTTHKLTLNPITTSTTETPLVDVVSEMMQALPDLNEGGFAGYLSWATDSYSHNLFMIGEEEQKPRRLLQPVLEKLHLKLQVKFRLSINEYKTYEDYWSFFQHEINQGLLKGSTLFMTSRLLNKAAVADPARVRRVIKIVSGEPQQHTKNFVLLVSGGKVFADAVDKSSGLNPAWRQSSMLHLIFRSASPGQSRILTTEDREAILYDITVVKGRAIESLAPGTGAYMNEGNPRDPEYIWNFYGALYEDHLVTKKKYDPEHVFYCDTCVGAEYFVGTPYGALCRSSSL